MVISSLSGLHRTDLVQTKLCFICQSHLCSPISCYATYLRNCYYDVSRIIGVDTLFETGEQILPELMPYFRFIQSTNLYGFLLHFLGQFRTQDGMLVTPVGRPFIRSPISDHSDEEIRESIGLTVTRTMTTWMWQLSTRVVKSSAAYDLGGVTMSAC